MTAGIRTELQAYIARHACMWPHMRPHISAVLQVAWCHPVHGRLLAVADAAGCISIWEEGWEQGQGAAYHSKPLLRDSMQPVAALAFAPPGQGLQLAAASTDGHVRCILAIHCNIASRLQAWHLDSYCQAVCGSLASTALS